jgi:DUF4097 and DUF4098 domain-containing protein YvlB
MTKTPFIAIALALVLPATVPAGVRKQQAPIELRSGSTVAVSNSLGPVSVRGGGTQISATAKYVDSGRPAEVDVRSVEGGVIRITPRRTSGGEISLDVTLPSDTRIGLVEATSGNVHVSGFRTDVRVMVSSGDARVSDVGGAVVRVTSGNLHVDNVAGSTLVESSSGDIVVNGVRGDLTVKARSGNATVEDVSGSVDAASGSGNFTLGRAQGSLRFAGVSGNIRVDGLAGNAEIQNASGNIDLFDVGGNCEATTVSGNVVFRGQLGSGRRYHLKSHSGNAVVYVCGDAPGFTITMRSYSGDIETEFPLTVDRASNLNRSVTGRFGDGSTQLEVDAFSGSAKLMKCDSSTRKNGRTK